MYTNYKELMMKNKKGFTLSEILAVIIILSLLLVIAVPASQGIASKVNEKLLSTKKSVSLSAAILWGQDNLSCFQATNVCSILQNESPCDSNFYCRSISLASLAAEGYIEYDDEDKKLITNPVNKKSMNDLRVVIKVHKENKNVTGFYK